VISWIVPIWWKESTKPIVGHHDEANCIAIRTGGLDFKYDSEKQTVVCDFTRGNTHGLWELTVKGNTMEGTLMLLPDKTLVRRVKLKKETANQPAA
jgi:hypothetical protein